MCHIDLDFDGDIDALGTYLEMELLDGDSDDSDEEDEE